MASALAAPTRACSNDTELWLTLLSVVNHSLRSDAAFASVHALQQGLQPAVDGVVPRLRLPETPLVVALQTRIGRAPVLAGRLGEANRPSLLFSVSAMGRELQVVTDVAGMAAGSRRRSHDGTLPPRYWAEQHRVHHRGAHSYVGRC